MTFGDSTTTCTATWIFVANVILWGSTNAAAQHPARVVNHSSPRVLPGISVPQQQAVISAPIEGLLAFVAVKEGDRVERGQLLARLDDRVAKAAVAAARNVIERRAEIAHATVARILAERHLGRLRAAGDAISASQLDEARARLEQARATLASAHEAQMQAKLNLALERARLERMSIRAPFAGTVTRVLANVGTTLTTSHELMHIASIAQLQVDLHVPLAMYRKLRVGTRYELRAGAPLNRRIAGRLLFIDPILDPSTRTMRCRFELEKLGKENAIAGFPVEWTGLKPMDTPRAKPAGR